MSKKMKVLLCVAGFLIAAIALSVSFFYSTQMESSNKTETESLASETEAEEIAEKPEPETDIKTELDETEQLAKDYAEEKYDFEVNVIKDEAASFYSSADVILSPKDDEDIRFGVIIDPYDNTIINDDYQFALKADKEYEKLKTVIPAIEELGFTGSKNNDFRISYLGDNVYLNLQSDQEVNYGTFVEEELDRYYELYKLVKESRATLENMSVFGSDDENGISLYLNPPEVVKTKEAFLIELKTSHWELINHEIVSKYATEMKNLNNDRFNFGNHYNHRYDDPFDSSLYCLEVTETAECTSVGLSVTYQADKLNSSNPYLKEDLTSILDFISTHLEPEFKVEFVDIDAKIPSLENLNIDYEERMKYESVDELIEFLLNE
ncbi:hypothetical protein [Planomicrobium sp. Y74]|uniref:hypothetical protein n=1 Tax=Planomicrobium sp. Y74 TaxID=2478977 RepID=UPI000EF4DF41|nr:hypothetical protein [Planomicrobium sp. Y74]RLQ91295.1 hypothetical protein D9754_06090 [Planomicrobium sp. Y74]